MLHGELLVLASLAYSMAASKVDSFNARSAKRTLELFGSVSSEAFLDAMAPPAKKPKTVGEFQADQEVNASEIKLASRILSTYAHVKDMPLPGSGKKNETAVAFLSRTASKSSVDGTLPFFFYTSRLHFSPFSSPLKSLPLSSVSLSSNFAFHHLTFISSSCMPLWCSFRPGFRCYI